MSIDFISPTITLPFFKTSESCWAYDASDKNIKDAIRDVRDKMLDVFEVCIAKVLKSVRIKENKIRLAY